MSEDYKKQDLYYSLALAPPAIALLTYFVLTSERLPWQAILIFGLLTFLSEWLTVDLPRVGAVSVSFAIIFAALLVLGPAGGAIIALFTIVTWRDIKKKNPWYIYVFNASQYVLAAGVAGLVYISLPGSFLLMGRGLVFSDFPRILLPLALSIATFYLINSWLVSISIGIAEGISPKNVWLINCKWGVGNYLALAPLGVVLAEVYVLGGPMGVVLLIAPLYIARQTFQVYMGLQKAYAETIASLVHAIEAKDPYTRGHSERVARYAEKIARQLNLPEDQIEALKKITVLHDVGKIGIPRKILCKPGQLTVEEFAKIREHPKIGVDILKDVEFLQDILSAVNYHHERPDGTGIYGLTGDNIPLFARIIAVADSYDAMTSNRPYRPALSRKKAAKEFVNNLGSQFDENITNAFFAALGLEFGGAEKENEKKKDGKKARKEQMTLAKDAT